MKAEEEIRRLRDVINITHVLLDDSNSNTFEVNVNLRPPDLDKNYWIDKEKIVATEQNVLRVLKFDIIVGHPHRLVVLLVKDLNLEQHIVKNAWKRLNGCLFYPKALTHDSLTLACAAVELEANQGIDTYRTVGDISSALSDLKLAATNLRQLSESE
mmetsp:Transcript_20722/g.31177  ORF Transcript_20722/g.31177 Transcript_20722/m.31177 type:complete len:157 (-) Transcript_20722:76-546(-)